MGRTEHDANIQTVQTTYLRGLETTLIDKRDVIGSCEM